ncbi:hypothetical protein F5Y19DRAFT_207833 [Xylariaceae sp. FL1651]|nr:hypothetical protein F5Y19DRAFT_207833 [Xylariaceae sp. FL1651]
MAMSSITLQQVQEDPKRKDIFGILNDYIQPDSSTPASQAASSYSQSVKPQDEGFFWDFWDQIFSVAEQLPHDNPAQDKLVAFLRELTLVPGTGDKVWGARVWTDLPLLGAAIREHLDQPSPPSNEDDEQSAHNNEAWISFHAFVARLLHAGISPGSETTAIWMLRAALEQQDAKPTDGNGRAFDRDLATAAVYIEYAGATLVQALALQPEPQLDEAQQRALKGGALWKGKSGLTAERWAFWGRRFRDQAESATGRDAKALAGHAARLIEVWGTTRLSST